MRVDIKDKEIATDLKHIFMGTFGLIQDVEEAEESFDTIQRKSKQKLNKKSFVIGYVTKAKLITIQKTKR